MNVQQMMAAVLEYVRGHPGTSFVELERLIGAPWSGDASLFLGPSENNIVVWMGVSSDASAAIRQLQQSGAIHLRQASVLTYMIDGKGLGLPVAKAERPKKHPHWLPVVFYAGKSPHGPRSRKKTRA